MIHKPGKPAEETKSYRPISLLSIQNKVFEKIFQARLSRHIQPKTIPDHQFGFRAKHSTIDQIQRITTTITTALERKQYCAAVFLDIAQAFDRVWHEGPIHKITQMLPINMGELIQNYLNDRKFFVSYGSVSSTLHPIRAGVPQGSVLGPFLYTIFTHDLPQPDGTTVLGTFADDTALLASASHYPDAEKELQSTVTKFTQWASDWKISINSEKSVHVDFTLRPYGYNPVYINNQIIPHAIKTRHLGIHLDERLTYKEHIKIKKNELEIRFQKLKWLLH